MTNAVKPALKINAELDLNIGRSGSEPEVGRVVSGPVIVIVPALMLPKDSTLSAGPV